MMMSSDLEREVNDTYTGYREKEWAREMIEMNTKRIEEINAILNKKWYIFNFFKV